MTQIEEVSEGKALAPSFLKVPTDAEVQEGKLVRLECRTAGKPAPDVSTTPYVYLLMHAQHTYEGCSKSSRPDHEGA